MGLGTGEIILIIVVIMILFGASKLPQVGDGLGRAIKNFKRSMQNGSELEGAGKKSDSDPSARTEKTETTTSSNKTA